MLKPPNSNGIPHVGNNRFEGYCADLAKKVFDIINVDYKIELVKDDRYGAKNENGSWDGMVGELVRGVSGHESTHVLEPVSAKIVLQRYGSRYSL